MLAVAYFLSISAPVYMARALAAASKKHARRSPPQLLLATSLQPSIGKPYRSTTKPRFVFPYTGVTAWDRYRTIMAYEIGCLAAPRVPMFSAKGKTYAGRSLGTATTDNARVIRENLVSHGMGMRRISSSRSETWCEFVHRDVVRRTHRMRANLMRLHRSSHLYKNKRVQDRRRHKT